MLTITPTGPHAPDVAPVLKASHALMRSLFVPGQCHFLSHDALDKPHIEMWAARSGDSTLGIIALANMGDYGEVKSLFVTPEARGTGTGRALLAHLEDRASALGLPCLRLETGTGLGAAIAMYGRAGFHPIGPFGDYGQDGADLSASVFMEKPLEP